MIRGKYIAGQCQQDLSGYRACPESLAPFAMRFAHTAKFGFGELCKPVGTCTPLALIFGAWLSVGGHLK